MCGICGVYWTDADRAADPGLIEQMCAAIIHRGPDEQGMHLEGPLGLGMRRLSIIDLATGSQPIFNEDQTICAVFNGEIYNFRELRARLQRQGHRFETQSDTEVLVHLYEEQGPRFVEQLNGMFAIALWDRPRRRLLLLRDRLGKKPLYYAWSGNGLVFGSELKCLLQADEVSRELDTQALYHYFTLGYIPHPFSIYRAVRQLPPAGRITIEKGRLQLDQYWQLDGLVNPAANKAELQQQLHELLADAVRLRMVSDVPLGAFLSGGIDSSIIVALMARFSSAPIKTFHIHFAESDYSERDYARAVAAQYGTEHHELEVRPSAIDVLDDLVHYFDEPFGDSSAVPTYYVSQLTRQHVTVALAGDGGDESFGGYQRYQRILARRDLPVALRRGVGTLGALIHRCLPPQAPGRRYLRSLGLEHYQFYAVGTQELETRELLSPEFLMSLHGTSTFALLRDYLRRADSRDRLAPYSWLDLHSYLPDDILTKVDRMSMANSLELRAPLLDYRVVELAAAMPWQWKLRDGVSKVILKELFEHDLPPQVLRQRKQGFSLPMEHWLRGELRPALDEALHDTEIGDLGFFHQARLRALAAEHYSGRRDRSEQLWRYLFFTRWWHHHQRGLRGRRPHSLLSQVL